jgi:regulator of Ty1 transposition protein 109
VYHLSTPATSNPALFAPLPGDKEQTTSCESQFLVVSSPQHDDVKEIFIYAIEVLIFTSKSLTTLFVSKADSTGFLARLTPPRGSASVAAIISSTFVEFLLAPRLTSSRVVVSLFARSQKQYLFPGSSENAEKHILDDRQLVKWWCRVFDKTLRLPRGGSTTTAHLLVPGCDKAETRAFFPPSSRADSPAEQKWIASYPVELMVTDPSLPPRHLIPRLPDDPKARFVGDLDGDFVDERGNWRSVKDLVQFWEFMSYRQECSAGRLVGFLWLIFSQSQTKPAAMTELRQTNGAVESRTPTAQTRLPTPRNSQQGESGITDSESSGASILELPPGPNSPPPSVLIQEESDRGLLQKDELGSATIGQTPSEKSLFPVVKETEGEIMLDADQYHALMEHLLETDFAGKELAAAASKSWVDKALEISNAAGFGWPVLGCAASVSAQTTATADTPPAQVNMLTAVRKKRKAAPVDDGSTRSDVANPATVVAVNTLFDGLVRKKPKS